MDLSKYSAMFVSEAREYLAQMEVAATQLQRSPSNREIIDQLFRHAHSVKGMAATMDFGEITELAHALEDLMAAFRDGEHAPDGSSLALLIEGIDTLSAQVDAREEGSPPRLAQGIAQKVRDFLSLPGLPIAAEEIVSDQLSEPRAEGGAPAAPAQAAAGAFDVSFRVAGAGPTAGVRAFLAIKRLNSVGAIESTTPPLDDVKKGRFDGPVLVRLRGGTSVEELGRVLKSLSDIASWAVRAAPDVPPPAPTPAAASADTVASDADVPAPRAETTVRVRTSFLDSFINAIGEFSVLRSRLTRLAQEREDQDLADVSERLEAQIKSLYTQVMGVRLMPLQSVTSILPRMVRDLARRHGREVSFEIRGQEIEVDRSVLEVLLDPLIHILRNSVDHGMEPPEERVAAGKPAEGKIFLVAYREKEKTIIEVSDDGRGLDPARIRRKAVEQGMIEPEAAEKLTDSETFRLICLPGFSTAQAVTRTSGRGVGMNAVKAVLDRIGGALGIESDLGKGTRFRMVLPRSVAMVPVLLVKVRGKTLAFPMGRVAATVSVAPGEIATSRGRRYCKVDDELVPVVALAEALLVGRNGSDKEPAAGAEVNLVLLEREEGLLAVEVDQLAGHQEAFIKPVGRPLDAIPCVGGVTLLGTGEPVFVVDPGALPLPA